MLPPGSSPDKFRVIFLAITSFIMAILMVITGKPLKTINTPAGIINLELAKNADETQKIILAWTKLEVIKDARLNTYLDFVFLISYSLLLYTVCKCLTLLYTKKWNIYISGKLALAALAAGGFDVLENVGMLMSLGGKISEIVVRFTLITSLLKWFIVFSIILWIVVSIAARGYRKITSYSRIDSAFAKNFPNEKKPGKG